MRSEYYRCYAVLAVLVLVLFCAALPALATKTVSTSDGLTLNLTDTGAFSSLVVNGNTLTTLSGVNGGFFIYPVDGLTIPTNRETFNAGTQVTGTATQNGANVTITGSAQNQTFSITLTGGLPYLKVDGTVTGNGTDHVFLVDFRLPVDATGWTWADSVIATQTIASGSGNWYFTPFHFWQARHPDLSQNPFSSISKTGVTGRGSLPGADVRAAAGLRHSVQLPGRLLDRVRNGDHEQDHQARQHRGLPFRALPAQPELGEPLRGPALLRVLPAVVRPRRPGGNWYIDPGAANRIATPTDFRAKYQEGTNWDDSYTQTNNILTMRYQEPWAMHITYTDPMVAETQAVDIAANHNVCGPCPNRGWQRDDQSDALLLSMVQQPDGYPVGPDEPGSWRDTDAWRWMMNPDPELSNFRNFNPGRTRAQLSEYQEWYYQWSTAPTDPSTQHFSGEYHDSLGSWVGWEAVWNFNPNHWATYDYNAVPYWGRYGNGMLSMWHLFNNIKFMKYTYQHMRNMNRPVMGNSSANFNLPFVVPYMDYIGACEDYDCGSSMQNMAIVRACSGPKPAGYALSASGGPQDETMIRQCMVFGVWPGCGSLAAGTTWEGLRSLYQTYMPRFDELDAAGWNPITGATASNTSMLLERFGPDSGGNIYYVLRAPSAGSCTVTVNSSDLGWSSSPNVTLTAKYGAAPSTSFDGNGNLVLNFGSLAASENREVQLHYNGTATLTVANFSASATTVAVNTQVNFTDSSSNSPTSWYWDFGDGNISTAQNPSHTYTSGGKYNVGLTATKASGQNTKIVDRYMTITAAPVADFWGKSQNGAAPVTTVFLDESSNFPTSWSWNFGDGNTSTVQNPTHVYSNVGTYNVALDGRRTRRAITPRPRTATSPRSTPASRWRTSPGAPTAWARRPSRSPSRTPRPIRRPPGPGTSGTAPPPRRRARVTPTPRPGSTP